MPRIFAVGLVLALLCACASVATDDRPGNKATPSAVLDGGVSVLEAYCIGTGGDISSIEKIVRQTNGVEIPSSALDANDIFTEPGGRGFLIVYGGERYAVLVSAGGACSVDVPNENVPDASELVERSYPVAPPAIDTSGPQEVRHYKLTERSVHYGGYLVISAPKNAASTDRFVTLGFIPKRVAERNDSR